MSVSPACLAPATHLDPKGRTLADRRQLRRLHVREAERRQVAVLGRKVRETANHEGKLREQQVEPVA